MQIDYVTYQLALGEVEVNLHMLDFEHNPFTIRKSFDTLKECNCFVDYVASHFPMIEKVDKC